MKGSGRSIVIAIGLLGAGIFIAVWVALWLIRGSYLTAIIMLGLAIWAFGFAAYYLYTSFGRATPRADSGATGTLLRPSRLVDALYVTPTAAVTVSAALFLAFSPLGMVDYVPTGVMRVSVPAGCVFLLLFGLYLLIWMLKQGGSGHLRLEPAGVEVWNGHWGTLRHASWDEVEEVMDRPTKGKGPPSEVLVLALPKGRSAVLMSDAITGDSATLREWVRFYWTHPESRDELVDDRGLRRLAAGDFSTG